MDIAGILAGVASYGWKSAHRESLKKRVKQAVDTWAAELPNGLLVDPQAVLPTEDGSPIDETPEAKAVYDAIATGRTPARELFHAALCARWRQIACTEAPVAFFQLDEREAAARLDGLAKRLHRAHYEEWGLFAGSVMETMERIDGKLSALAGARHSPLFYVPRPNPNFVGRDLELQQLQAVLTKDGASTAISASIDGLAGFGKSELAKRLGHGLREGNAFPGGIVWLDAENPDLTEEWSRIAGLARFEAETPEERAELVMQNLERAPSLLILDNVVDWARTPPAPLPDDAVVLRLITTRRKAHLPGFKRMEISQLDLDASLQLLRDTAGRDVGPGVEALLAHLGGHALAIELAGAYLLEAEDLSAKDYLARVMAGDPLDDELEQYERTVRVILDQVWCQLSEGARRAWLRVGQLAPAPASTELLEACGVEASQRRELSRFHLLRYRRDDAAWDAHRLVRDFARFQAASVEARTRAVATVVHGCQHLCASMDLSTGFQRYRRNAAQLDFVAADIVSKGPLDRSGAALLRTLATGLHSNGDLRRARDYEERAVEAFIRLLGKEHPDTLQASDDLACTLTDQGELERSVTLHRQTLDARRRILGEEHPDTLQSQNNLALALHNAGEYGEARSMREALVTTTSRVLGADHRRTLICKSNLATTLAKLEEWEAARTLQEQILAVRVEELGEEHPETLTIKNNLANTHIALDQLDVSRHLLEQALEAETRLKGEEHPDTLLAKHNLAGVLSRLAKPAGAKMLREVLEARVRHLGAEHPETLRTKVSVAGTLHADEQFAAARALLEEVLNARTRTLGPGHVDTLACQHYFALALHAEGSIDAARAQWKQLLDVARRAPGHAHSLAVSAQKHLQATEPDGPDHASAQ